MNVGLLGSTTPERPGPGPLPAAALRALQIEVGRRLQGMLAGDYRSTQYGDGVELAQVRPYVPGDDVRRIEWNVTARMGEPHVRVTMAERVLVTWLLLDTSPSMHFGTGDRRKADVADGVALAVGHVATRRGNRLGLSTFGDRKPTTLPPNQGRHGLIGLLGALQREPEDEHVGADVARRRAVAHAARSRGSAAWSSSSPTSAARSTGASRCSSVMSRHEVLAVEIRDPREQELPDVGDLWLVDPETGRQVRVDTRSRSLRERFAEAAAEERSGVARVLSALGVPHVRALDARRLAAALCRLPRRGAAPMSFERPLVLIALAALPVVALLWRALDHRRTAQAASFSTAALIPNLIARSPGGRRLVPLGLFLVALAALIVGAARPHAHVSVPRKEATVVLAIDVSRSMTAEDVRPSRLAAARNAAEAFLSKVPKEYSIAVLGFGTRAFVAVPPTTDRVLAHDALASLAPSEGTAIGDAVALAVRSGSGSARPTGRCRRPRCC